MIPHPPKLPEKSPERGGSGAGGLWGIAIGIVLLLIAMAVAGCVQESVPQTTSDPGPGILIDYQRTGGIAGVDDHLVIFENGAAVISSRNGTGYQVISKGDLEQLKQIFLSAGFSDLSPSYGIPSRGADYFTYQITFREKTVTVAQAGVPPALEPVIRALDGIVATGGSLTASDRKG
jgi:hypothetical protein